MQLMGVYACVCVLLSFLLTLISSQLLQQQTCHLISGLSHLPVVAREGNVTLGGLFSLHDAMMETRLSFTSQPQTAHCTGSVIHFPVQKHTLCIILLCFYVMHVYLFYEY